MRNNKLKSLPEHFFEELPALKALLMSGNLIEGDELARIQNIAREKGITLESEMSPAGQNIPQQINSKSVVSAIESVQSFVLNHWHVPLNINVFPKNPAQRSMEESLAIRQIFEIRAAYNRASIDFFKVEIGFGDPKISFDGENGKLTLIIKNKIATQDEILAALIEDFTWKRKYHWYRENGNPSGKLVLSEEDLKAAIERDYTKFIALRTQLQQDILQLDYLVDNAEQSQRALKEGRPYFTDSEIVQARYLQFRALFGLQRVLNTMVRWSVAVTDPGFPYPDEIKLLLSAGSALHSMESDHLLGVIVGGRSVFNIFSDSWRHRNPIYVVLDSEIPEGAIEWESKRSPRIPDGSVRAMLNQKLDFKLNRWLKKAASLYITVNTNAYEESFVASQMSQIREKIVLPKLIYKKKVSVLRAFKELWDANVKDTAHFPIYKLISGIAGIIGDTRVINPEPSITDAQMEQMESQLKPGDILLERSDYFMSNAFLPGFWPHTIIYLGKKEEWSALRTADGRALGEDPWIQENILPKYFSPFDQHHPARVIEAISDGVVFNSMHHAAQKDDIVIIRPQISEADIAESISRALRHHGKPYDFEFNFFTDDKIVCSELAFRAYSHVINFEVQKKASSKPNPRVPGLKTVAGRDTMPSQEIAELAIYMNEHPEPDTLIGYPGKVLEVVAVYVKEARGQPVRVITGPEALEALRWTLKK